MTVGLECNEVGQHLDSLALTQEALDEEIAKLNKLLTSNQAKSSSFVLLIEQKQGAIANYNKKICQIAANTGVRDSGEVAIPGCLLFMLNIIMIIIHLYNHKKISKNVCVSIHSMTT